MSCKSTLQSCLRVARASCLVTLHARRPPVTDHQPRSFRHIPQHLWDRHSALLLASRSR